MCRAARRRSVAVTISALGERAISHPDADSAAAALLAVHELRYPGEAEHADRVARLAFDLTVMMRPALAEWTASATPSCYTTSASSASQTRSCSSQTY
jgi:hypothetical protein